MRPYIYECSYSCCGLLVAVLACISCVICCRVGNGMTDAELQTVREKLNPYFVPFAQKPKNYKVTNSRKTQPDMWVKDVSKSIVLQACLQNSLGTLRIQLIEHLDLTIGLDTLHMLQCIYWLDCVHLIIRTEGLST